jgi:hypothetical protein
MITRLPTLSAPTAACRCRRWGVRAFLLWRPRAAAHDGGMAWMGAAALLVGFVLGSRTKENFLVLALPMLVMLGAEVRAGGSRTRRPHRLGWAVLVAGPIILSLEFLGVDVYQQPVAPRVRSAVLLQSLGRATPLHYATAVPPAS